MAMLPESGSFKPATQSSSVVLPAPEAPKTMVKPVAEWKSTSRTKSNAAPIRLRTCACSMRDAVLSLSMSMNGSEQPSLPVQAVDDGQHGKADDQQQQRSGIRGGVVRSLHLVEDLNRDCARNAGNVSAHHEDYSEFSHGMRERQSGAGNEPRLRERNSHAKESFQRG